MTASNLDDFKALEPYFFVIKQGLAGLVDGEQFFDFFADDTVIEFVITVPGYPRRVVGRDNLAALYRGYGDTFVLDSVGDLAVYHDRQASVVVLEYSSHGRVVATGHPYSNRYISVITILERKIRHWRDYLDPLAVFDALGVTTLPTAEDRSPAGPGL